MKKSLIIIITLIFSVFSFSQNNKFLEKQLNDYIQKGLKEWKIPGLSIAIVKDGKVILNEGYGVKSIELDEEVDENTLFMIGSNTKSFTGILMGMLEEEGLISLEDKVVDYLPDFKLETSSNINKANLIDVVSHRMGTETFQGDFTFFGSSLTSREVIESYSNLTPPYDFRTKWGYCNSGYAIAAEVIKNKTGENWANLVSNRIFSKLEMTRSICLSKDLPNQENIALPYSIHNMETTPIEFWDIDNLAPAGSISSSSSDMSKWIIALLNKGVYNDEQVISQKAIHKAWTPYSIIGKRKSPFNKSHFTLYGLGWKLQDYENREIISHTGGVPGYLSSVTLVPEENLGVVILTNTDDNSFFEALKMEIIDAYLDLEYRNYSKVYLESYLKEKNKEESRIKSLNDSVIKFKELNKKNDLPLFEGEYYNNVYGEINIKNENDKLFMTFQNHPKLIGTLEQINENEFLCTYSDFIYGVKVLPFKISKGEVKSFELIVNSFVEFTPYTFLKK